VAVSQARSGISQHLSTHQKEIKTLLEVEDDISDVLDPLLKEGYLKEYLGSSGEFLLEESKLDETDQAKGHDQESLSGVKQINASKYRVETFQEIDLKSPLLFTLSSQLINYGTFHHSIFDSSHVLGKHRWVRSQESLSHLSDTYNLYTTNWKIETDANLRQAVGNSRVYSDYFSLQVGQDGDNLHPENTQLDGSYGTFSLDCQTDLNVNVRKGNENREVKEGTKSEKVALDYAVEANNYSVTSTGNTIINGSVVMINTTSGLAVQPPETYTDSYNQIEDLPEMETKEMVKKTGVRHIEENGKPVNQRPPGGATGTNDTVQRRAKYG
jgi:hypothetical protein